MNLPDWTYQIPWDSARGELLLEVSAILTEPVCPTVSLKWETSGEVLCRYDRDTVQLGVDAAIAWAKANIAFKPATQTEPHPSASGIEGQLRTEAACHDLEAPCSCDFDGSRQDLLTAAADEIARLRGFLESKGINPNHEYIAKSGIRVDAVTSGQLPDF